MKSVLNKQALIESFTEISKADDDKCYVRNGEKVFIRFDKIEVEYHKEGLSVQLFWKDKIAKTMFIPWSAEEDNCLRLEGLQGMTEVEFFNEGSAKCETEPSEGADTFPPNSILCTECGAKAAVNTSGCFTCLNCNYSKCS